MNTTAHLTDTHADRLARRVAAQLDQGLTELPHDISERLRAARTRAVAARRQPVMVQATGFQVQKGALTDELPPTAYTDPGFLRFIRAGAPDSTSPGASPD